MAFKDVIDKVKDALGLGPDSWDERLLDSCELISPEGQTFKPSWRSDPRSFSKRLGVYDFPQVAGSIIQDLDVSAVRYTFTLFFGGKDTDLDSEAFFNACKQKGKWTIVHPMYGGFYELYLSSVNERTDPTGSGGVTVFETSWIEPTDPESLQVGGDSVAEINRLIQDLNISAAQQFANNVAQFSAELVQNIEDATDLVTAIIEKGTSPLFTTLDAINSVVLAVQRGIQTVKTQQSIVTASLAGQIQQLAQIPALVTLSAEEKLIQYRNALADLDVEFFLDESIPIGENPLSKKNRLATLELGTLAIVGAVGRTGALSNPVTREDSLRQIASIEQAFTSARNSIDRGQTATEGQHIEERFIAQAESFAIMDQLLAAIARRLLNLAPSLKVKKTFRVPHTMATAALVLQEYGTLGANDSVLGEFIAVNKLREDEIMILPLGKEVTVYV